MFTNFGSMNNTDPKLGPLADNGGPTLTMALLQGSPAIDAGDDTAAPPIDQRGFPRPFGLASDIGAYECGPPTITMPPLSQTAESGSTICLAVQASGDSILTYLWFCNGTNLISCGANGLLELTDVQFSHSGTYTVVVTNVFGAVTSAPVMLNVIAPIPRRPVPAIQLTGDLGSDLHVEYTDTLGLAANWLPLGTVTLTNTSQFSYDTTEPLPPQRFYCAWQSGTPVVVPSLQLPSFVLAITLTGDVGNKLRLDYINAIGPIDAWITLDTITLSNTAQLYFDVSAPGQPVRLYRIVPVP
jgi:hypothetical protein